MLLQRQIKKQIDALCANDTTGFKTAITALRHAKLLRGDTPDKYPIVVYSFLPTSGTYYFDSGSSPSTETLFVVFKILSANTTNAVSTEAENILEKLHGVYDGASLTLSGWSLREMLRDKRDGVVGPYVDDSGIWHLNTTYRLICDRL